MTGEDIKTKFEIVEGRITSVVTALRQDFATDRGYLNNPAFDDGLMKWNTENECSSLWGTGGSGRTATC